LQQPAYAGAHTYGKQHRTRVPGAQMKVVTRKLPMDEWAALIAAVGLGQVGIIVTTSAGIRVRAGCSTPAHRC